MFYNFEKNILSTYLSMTPFLTTHQSEFSMIISLSVQGYTNPGGVVARANNFFYRSV